MCPHPPRPFQAYNGPPAAKGDILRIFRNFCMLFQESEELFSQHDSYICRVDCAFDPYSEDWIRASIDMQVVYPWEELLIIAPAASGTCFNFL